MGLYFSFKRIIIICKALAVMSAAISGMALPQNEPTIDDLVTVVATTNIVGDIVSQIGESNISIYVMIPPGFDPHQHQLTPLDLRKIYDADRIFISGSGLEDHFLGDLLSNLSRDRVVRLSGNRIPAERENLQSHGDLDPHVWMDPIVVAAWAKIIANSLSEIDPSNNKTYKRNAFALEAELNQLDDWVKQRVATIPSSRRILVSDHLSFRYFAARYGFRLEETVIASLSTASQLSARRLSVLKDLIKTNEIPAIFVGTTVNSQLVNTLARELGAKMVILYTDSLSDSDGPASNYQDYIRTNVNRIVDALTENRVSTGEVSKGLDVYRG